VSATRLHWRRFDRIELEICWAAIATLDIADKLTLLRELATEVAAAATRRRTPIDKVVAAVVSRRSAAEVLGRSPTQYEYRQMRLELPELNLVPDVTLRRWLGDETWSRCLARALLDTVSEGDFVTLNEGDRFSEEELVDAVRMFMSEHEQRVPTCRQLLTWAHSPLVRAREGRRPLSHAPFVRFDGYPTVLERNGILRKDSPRFDVRGRLLPLRWRFTDEELHSAINEGAREVGHTPREADYREALERRRARVATDAGRVDESVSFVAR
jgi:hypothetical protein